MKKIFNALKNWWVNGVLKGTFTPTTPAPIAAKTSAEAAADDVFFSPKPATEPPAESAPTQEELYAKAVEAAMEVGRLEAKLATAVIMNELDLPPMELLAGLVSLGADAEQAKAAEILDLVAAMTKIAEEKSAHAAVLKSAAAVFKIEETPATAPSSETEAGQAATEKP